MTSDHICGCFWVPPRFDPFPFWWGFFLPAFEIGLTGSSWRPVHGFLLRLVICCKTTHSPKSKGNYQSVRDITFLVSTVLCEIEVLICLSKFPIHPPKSLLRVDPCSRSLCWISWSPWWACRSVGLSSLQVVSWGLSDPYREHCYTRHFPSHDSNEKTQAQKLKDQLLNIVVQAERPELAEDKAWAVETHTHTHTLEMDFGMTGWGEGMKWWPWLCVVFQTTWKPDETFSYWRFLHVMMYSLLCDLYSLYSLLPAICIAHIHCRDEH